MVWAETGRTESANPVARLATTNSRRENLLGVEESRSGNFQKSCRRTGHQGYPYGLRIDARGSGDSAPFREDGQERKNGVDNPGRGPEQAVYNHAFRSMQRWQASLSVTEPGLQRTVIDVMHRYGPFTSTGALE